MTNGEIFHFNLSSFLASWMRCTLLPKKSKSRHVICTTPWFTSSVLNTHCQVTWVVSVSTRNIAASQKHLGDTQWGVTGRIFFFWFSCHDRTLFSRSQNCYLFLTDVYCYNSYYTNYSDSKYPAKRFSYTIYQKYCSFLEAIYFILDFFPVFNLGCVKKKIE